MLLPLAFLLDFLFGVGVVGQVCVTDFGLAVVIVHIVGQRFADRLVVTGVIRHTSGAGLLGSEGAEVKGFSAHCALLRVVVGLAGTFGSTGA